jgi:hypothetical protein
MTLQMLTTHRGQSGGIMKPHIRQTRGRTSVTLRKAYPISVRK